MEKRVKPKMGLVAELLGIAAPSELRGTHSVHAGAIHHGLYETSLSNVYPVLNLEEALTFAAGSWVWRNRDEDGFTRMMDGASLQKIFKEVLGSPVYPGQFASQTSLKAPAVWLNLAKKHMSPEMKIFYGRLNPYNRLTLQDRLAHVPDNDAQELIKTLGEPTFVYSFESEYDPDANKTERLDEAEAKGKELRCVSNLGQNKYPKTVRGVVLAYSGMINKMLRTYPQEHFRQEELIPEPEPVPEPVIIQPRGQARLF